MQNKLLIKSSSLLYLFDFDGTVAGSDDWQGFIKNCKLCFQRRHINPNDFDIRWCILTARPIIDRMLIKLVCWYHKLYPQQIITGPTIRYKFKDENQEIEYKEKVIKDILDGKFKINFTTKKIEKILYIDNNLDINKGLNQNRKEYRYLALTVGDFLDKNYQDAI